MIRCASPPTSVHMSPACTDSTWSSPAYQFPTHYLFGLLSLPIPFRCPCQVKRLLSILSIIYSCTPIILLTFVLLFPFLIIIQILQNLNLLPLNVIILFINNDMHINWLNPIEKHTRTKHPELYFASYFFLFPAFSNSTFHLRYISLILPNNLQILKE